MKRFKIHVITCGGHIDFFVWSLNSELALSNFLREHINFLDNEIVVYPA